MTETIKPCPFCGGVGYLDKKGETRPTWAIICRSCAANGPWSKCNETDAIFRWNMRTPNVIREIEGLSVWDPYDHNDAAMCKQAVLEKLEELL